VWKLANPTIINPSDLPSRRRSAPTAAKRPRIFDALAPAYPSLADPFSSPEASSASSDSEDEVQEEIDEQEVYDLISTISDPEHPLSLGSLGVVKLEDISILPPTSPRS
jgi:metal-sulfur cluster biosynthetic enzyme